MKLWLLKRDTIHNNTQTRFLRNTRNTLMQMHNEALKPSCSWNTSDRISRDAPWGPEIQSNVFKHTRFNRNESDESHQTQKPPWIHPKIKKTTFCNVKTVLGPKNAFKFYPKIKTNEWVIFSFRGEKNNFSLCKIWFVLFLWVKY